MTRPRRGRRSTSEDPRQQLVETLRQIATHYGIPIEHVRYAEYSTGCTRPSDITGDFDDLNYVVVFERSIDGVWTQEPLFPPWLAREAG